MSAAACHASLVFDLHAPWRATLAECLKQWASLDKTTQAASYLVIESDIPGYRHTIAASGIADLVSLALMTRKARTQTGPAVERKIPMSNQYDEASE